MRLSQEKPPIDKFEGEYRWLSNFYPSPVYLDGVRYPTVEHAFQAAKFLDGTTREMIRTAPTPARAKALGKTLRPLRSGWDQMRVDIMRGLIQQKFRDPEMRARLLATEDRRLVEGNDWNDTFWGVCRGRGANYLGILLMETRTRIANGSIE